MRRHHLDHGIANREGTEKDSEEQKSHVEVSGGGDSKESPG